MRPYIILTIALLSLSQAVNGQTPENDLTSIREEVTAIQAKQSAMEGSISSSRKEINVLREQQESSLQKMDSLNHTISLLRDSLKSANQELKNDIYKTSDKVSESEATLSSSIKSRTITGGVIVALLAILGAIASFLLGKKIGKASYKAKEISDSQAQLRSAQKKLERESIQIDNKLVELIEKQLDSSASGNETDHSLTLKVADEITRIELNLSRMDPGIKGYKQLKKGVERIKNNFLAKGYEIADMLGKSYNEGMRINADFVLDDTLEPGTRTITSITRPQVTYNGEMIQKAIVTVTQNI